MTLTATMLTLVPLLPLGGFAALALGHRMRARAVAVIGAGSVGLSFAAAAVAAATYIAAPAGGAVQVVLYRWLSVAGFAPDVSLRLDELSTVFMLVITGVGFLIHLYSIAFMSGDEGYARYFAAMNLFVSSMLVLVLADNLLLLYLGWEGVGLCSYLLIGHWYGDAVNGRAARKAFIVTRVGDAALAIGLFLLFQSLGTLNIDELLRRAAQQWSAGDPLAVAAGVLLLAGAVGKSAQLPLQVWLPDAMAGPTPVSALIHAATMVTAGVYLIIRMHGIYELAPAARTLVAVVGCATMLLAGLSALAQTDVKRTLAYSTISQIGYMFLACGVGAYAAGAAHFVTHALFKSALFLGAGILIYALPHGHDMFHMGGLRQAMPTLGRFFLMATLTLAAVPPLSLTFNSKDLILQGTWSSHAGHPLLTAGALLGAFITAAYAMRLYFVTFEGPRRQSPSRPPGKLMLGCFAILAFLGGVAGLPDLVAALGGRNFVADFLARSMPAAASEPAGAALWIEQAGLAALSLAAMAAAYVLYLRRPAMREALLRAPAASAAARLALAGFGFDWAYDRLIVRPLLWLWRLNRRDAADVVARAPARISERLYRAFSAIQTGNLRWYVACAAAGGILYLALAVLL